jgi:alpha-galactosidase
LEVGNGGLTEGEERLHFFAWAALKAPLILGNDLRHMTTFVRELLANEEIIAINQDALGKSATRINKVDTATGQLDTWAGPLANGDYVVGE